MKQYYAGFIGESRVEAPHGALGVLGAPASVVGAVRMRLPHRAEPAPASRGRSRSREQRGTRPRACVTTDRIEFEKSGPTGVGKRRCRVSGRILVSGATTIESLRRRARSVAFSETLSIVQIEYWKTRDSKYESRTKRKSTSCRLERGHELSAATERDASSTTTSALATRAHSTPALPPTPPPIPPMPPMPPPPRDPGDAAPATAEPTAACATQIKSGCCSCNGGSVDTSPN